jgi:DNA-binding NarL/FixJ family response regulator
MSESLMARGAGRILMLDGDALLRRAVRRTLSRVARVVGVRSCGEADAALRDGFWMGFIVELSLPDGSGLDWLAGVRARGDCAPALVVSAVCKRAPVNRAFELDARYLCKPFRAAALRAFEGDVVLHAERHERDRFAGITAALTREHGLSRAETEIALAALQGAPAREIAEERGVSMNTHKTQVKNALRKVQAESFRQLRERVLRNLRG